MLKLHEIPKAIEEALNSMMDEFGEISIAWLITNKNALLRLPAGAVLTFSVLSDTGIVAVATACTMSVHGFKGKVLVA